MVRAARLASAAANTYEMTYQTDLATGESVQVRVPATWYDSIQHADPASCRLPKTILDTKQGDVCQGLPEQFFGSLPFNFNKNSQAESSTTTLLPPGVVMAQST